MEKEPIYATFHTNRGVMSGRILRDQNDTVTVELVRFHKQEKFPFMYSITPTGRIIKRSRKKHKVHVCPRGVFYVGHIPATPKKPVLLPGKIGCLERFESMSGAGAALATP